MSPHLVGCLLELPCLTYKMVAAKRGLLVTMENPKTSYFWITKWVMGGDRYKWTEISQMDIRCNRQHQAAWGFAKKTWATSQESQYRKKMGVCLGQTVLQRLCKQDLTFQATLEHIADHPLKAACCEHKLLLAFCGKSCRLWCLSSQAFSNIQQLSHLPCSLMAKLKSPLSAFTSQKQTLTIPAASLLLRFFLEIPDHSMNVSDGQESSLAFQKDAELSQAS